MHEFSLGYREVIPDQTIMDPWKEIILNTGGTQGTLQDIKVAERASGFCYRDSSQHHTRNRFIYWRINHDVLELVEHSLDVNLAGNRIRYRFVDTPILDGVSIHETRENVIVLVPTVCCVRRLIFAHPNKYHRQDDIIGIHPDLAAPSIFSEATIANVRDPTTFHFFTNTNTSSQLPCLADSSLSLAEEEAVFALAYPSGEILVIKQSVTGKVETIELKNESSIVPRFLSGLADKLRQKDKEGETIVSLLVHTFGLETYVLTLCRNGNLQFWSCSKAECVAAIDVVSKTGEMARNQIQGAQNHILRKAFDGYDSQCHLAVFMSFSSDSQIHVLKPVINGSQIRLIRLNALHLAQNDLIDFALSTTRIWSVWQGKDGECEVYTSSLLSSSYWVPVVLDSVPDAGQPPNMDGETDPRQVYLQHIFHPGRFPLHIIGKALNIYKRTAVIGDVNLSALHLKQQICMAVEDEIQNELKETVVSDEDYLECAHYCWQRFYSCCVQYHIAGLKPLGLLLLPNSSGAVLLKKSMISFLRPLEVFEYLTYNIDCTSEDQFDMQCFSEDVNITEDVLNLFKVINYLNQQMSEVFAYTFEKELSLLKAPDVVMSQLLEKIQSEMDHQFTDHVAKMLDKCTDLYQTIYKILELLEVDHQLPTEEADLEQPQTIKHIFTSQLGVSVVAGCFRQQSQIRFIICRNLLMISSILLKREELEWTVLEAIHSVCNPEIVVFTQASYVMLWLSSLPALSSLPTDKTTQRLSSLKLSPVFNLRTNAMNSIALLELFTGSTGGYEARKAFSKIKRNEDSLAQWHLSLLPYLSSLYHIIWPVSGKTTLPEWLLSCGQHLWLQQYVRYLSDWCELNSCTHSFLLATSLLINGECYKAQELFKSASKGIFTDGFLAQRILTVNDDNETRAFVNYYLKVIHLFELHRSFDCAINLANSALCVTLPDDPIAATLYSVKFKHHLALKDYEMAYDSLDANPDSDRKKDNLRDLVKKLLDEKKLDVLMNFSYGCLEELFCNIIFTRARATDANNNVYYDFLYGYLVKRGQSFSRLAASVMYEQAFRLAQLNDPDSLEKQVKYFLAAKNALLLCEPQYAYIVMPVDSVEDKVITLPALTGSDNEPEEIILKKQINIINLETLQKELSFTMAKLKLFRYNPRSHFDITMPYELVVLLTSEGLFKTALKTAKTFDLPYNQIFEALAKRCGILLKQNDPAAWKWLIENDLQDLPANTKSATDASWNLLEECIGKYEEDKMSVIHKVVCKQIIKMHLWIPHWLLASYKKRNPAELFRLFYNAGRLEEAVEVACEYMMAAMGYGKENYGFSHSLQAAGPAVCLPVHAFANLLQQLRLINENNTEKPLLAEYNRLKGISETYLDTTQRISNEMCLLKLNLMNK